MYVTNSHSLNKFGASEKKHSRFRSLFLDPPSFQATHDKTCAKKSLRTNKLQDSQLEFRRWLRHVYPQFERSRAGMFRLDLTTHEVWKTRRPFFGGTPWKSEKIPGKMEFCGRTTKQVWFWRNYVFGTYLFLKDWCYLDVIFHVGSMIHQFWSGSEVAKLY